jgi:hypothetical protein
LIITFAFGARSTIRRVCPSIFSCQRPQIHDSTYNAEPLSEARSQ